MPNGTMAGPPDRVDPLHPHHDAVPLHRAATEIIAQWPAGTFLENLTPDLDGESWLVTAPSDKAIYRVGLDQRVHTAAQVDGTPTGITSHRAVGVLAAVGTQGQPDWRLARITAHGAEDVCALPHVLSANGLTWAGDRLLVADSGRSNIVAVDVAAGTTAVWLEHPLLTPVSPDSPLPGVNGLDFHAGSVIISSSDRGLILTVSATSERPAADLRVVAERLVGDDLAVADDGRIFVATHTYHSVLCLYPDGSREDVAVHADGIAGPTAVAISAGHAPALYVSTTGGLLSPAAGEVEPARLVRVDALRP